MRVKQICRTLYKITQQHAWSDLESSLRTLGILSMPNFMSDDIIFGHDISSLHKFSIESVRQNFRILGTDNN